MRTKLLLSLLILMLALSLVAAGCGGGEEAPEQTGEEQSGEETQSSEPEVETVNLLMGTGGTGGTYYPLGGAIAEAWNSHIDGLNVTVQSTGASVENIRLIGSGEADLGMAMNGPAMAGYEGTGDFEGNAVQNFYAIGVIYPEVMQIITPKDSGIETVADLKGKRVSVGPPGSGTASSALKILEAYGIDPDNDIDRFDDNFSDGASKIKDGLLDAAFAVLAVPAANVIDISTSTPVNIVDIEGEGLEAILAADPTFSAYEIPAGTYKGLDDIGHTVSQWAVLYVTDELSDDLAYQMAKVMYENTDEIAAAHASGNQITIDNATKGIAPVPFHPGAIKYYEEVGIPVE